MLHEETIEFSWNTYEYEHREKSADWYWALGILVVVGATIAFISKNLLFGFLILMGGFMLGLFAGKKNDPLEIEISQRGVRINGETIDFNSITGFWMYRTPHGIRKLILKTSRNLIPVVVLPLPDEMKATDLRDFLMKYIPEQEMREGFVDLLLERIGF